MPKQSIFIIFLAIISTFILSISGCGSSNPVSNTTTAPTASASAYTKLTTGNTWTWNINQNITSSANILGVASTSTIFINASRTSQYGVTTASGTTVTTLDFIPGVGSSLISPTVLSMDVSGNLIGVGVYPVASSTYTYLPANLTIGTTWSELSLLSGVIIASGSIQHTVAGINISKTVSGFALPFNDVMQINISGNNVPALIYIPGIGTIVTPANITGSYFISKQVGNIISANITATVSSSLFFFSGGSILVPTTITINSTQTLQPGYIAN